MSLSAIAQGAASAATRTLRDEVETRLAATEAVANAGIGVIKRTVTIALGDVSGLADGVMSVTKALSGGALPANARFAGVVARSLTGFTNSGGGATYTLKVGGADDDEIIASLNVATGQTGFPKTGTLGVAGFMMCPLAAEVKNAILTSNTELNDVSAGSITIDLFYLVLA